MTEEQRMRIVFLRKAGNGYKKISQELLISENTVKSYCQRHKIGKAETRLSNGEHCCQYCGKAVRQNPGRKAKKFCSDKCRNAWWNSHLDQVERKAHYEFVCAFCKKPFTAYGNAGRKYCSHACYVSDRFGGGAGE